MLTRFDRACCALVAGMSTPSNSMQSTGPITASQQHLRRNLPRASKDARLTSEDKCKYAALNQHFDPTDEWQKAYDAENWDQEWNEKTKTGITEKYMGIIDTAWEIEKAKMARAQQEQKKEFDRLAAQKKRNKEKAAAAKPINKFAKAHNLSIVHEASTKSVVDELATSNPLSEHYEGDGKRKRKPKEKEPSPSPSPDPELEEEAVELGIGLVPKHKAKRQKQGDDVASAMEKAKEVLKGLSEDFARVKFSFFLARICNHLLPNHRCKSNLHIQLLTLGTTSRVFFPVPSIRPLFEPQLFAFLLVLACNARTGRSCTLFTSHPYTFLFS